MLRMLARDTVGLGKHVDALKGKFGALKVAAVGFATAWAGEKVLRGMWTLTQYGDKLVEQQSKLRQLGVSGANIRTITTTAINASRKYPGVVADQAVETGIYARETLGTSSRAQRALPTLVRMLADLENMPVLKGDPMHALHSLIKSVDILGLDTTTSGKLSVSGLDVGMREMLAAVQQSQGLVTPAMLYRTIRQIGAQGRMFDMRTFMPVIAEAAAQMGVRGARGVANVVKQLTGGTFGKSYGDALVRFGLLRHGYASLLRPKHGGMESLKNGNEVIGSHLLYANEPAWVANVLIPALVKHGYKTIPQQLSAINQLFSTKPGTAFLGSQISNPEAYARATDQMNKQLGVSTFKTAMASSPQANMKAMIAAWHSFLEVAGSSLVPLAIKGLHAVTNGIVALTGFAQKHPEAMANIAKGLVVLGAGLMAFGTAAVVAALATIGGIPALIAGVVTALASLAAVFPKLRNAIEHSFIGGTIAGLYDRLTGSGHPSHPQPTSNQPHHMHPVHAAMHAVHAASSKMLNAPPNGGRGVDYTMPGLWAGQGMGY